jgi:4-amino-4-deoxy-L-arabinose transferase-like glycosyltransferase
LFTKSSVASVALANRELLLILGLAFVVRLTALGPVHAGGYTSDEREYSSMAHRLAGGGEFVDSNGERSTRSPLFPFALAGILKSFGGRLIIPELVGCVLGTLVVLLVYLLGMSVWNMRQAALISAGVTAVYPGLVIYSALLQTETLYIVFFLLALLAASRAAKAPAGLTMITLGIVGGLAALTRAVFAGFFPLLLLLILWERRHAWRSSLAPLVLALVVFCLVLAPWTARNYAVHHAVIPISSGGGNSLLTGNNPFATGTWRTAEGFDLWYEARAREMGVEDVDRLPEVQKSTLSGKIALDYIFSHPLEVARLLVKKSYVYWIYPITHSDSDIPVQAVAVGCDFILLLGSVLGILAAGNQGAWRMPLYVAMFFFFVTQVVLHAEARFRLPVVPLLGVLFGGGLASLIDGGGAHTLISPGRTRTAFGAAALLITAIYVLTGVLFVTGSL